MRGFLYGSLQKWPEEALKFLCECFIAGISGRFFLYSFSKGISLEIWAGISKEFFEGMYGEISKGINGRIYNEHIGENS